jgi:hypothetical protein
MPALILSAHLFLNSILGMFGLAATSVGALATLQASQRIVDTMKARHARKQTRITKRFIKRSGRCEERCGLIGYSRCTLPRQLQSGWMGGPQHKADMRDTSVDFSQQRFEIQL